MMRKLFIAVTTTFWLAVLGIWASGMRLPTEIATAGAVAGNRTWPLAELARHDKAGDCWMAIDGAVYDVSAYLPQHPSDPAVILPWCGKEASEAYRTKSKGRPHSAYADTLLPKYRIGQLDMR